MCIDDRNASLKYFYLIDVEQLAKKVTAKLNEYNSTEPNDIFRVMFNEIDIICRPYLEFIYSPDSFNHADRHDSFVPQIHSLYQVLKNHCILHGFLSAVKEDSKGTVKISGAKDHLLKLGYFKTERYMDDSSLASSDTDLGKPICQKYNQYKRRFLNHPDFYAYRVLEELSTDCNEGYFTVHDYDGGWGCFIYTASRVYTLDKNISNRNSAAILKNYEYLLNDSIQWCQEHALLPEDRLLFESAMEQIYGFRFFSYAAELLHKVCTAPPSFSDTDVTYKDLEGSVLLSLIRQASRLPVIYGKSFFLDHAISSVIRGRYLKDREYRGKSTSLFSSTSREPVSKQLLVTSGFEQIRKYFQKLKYLAIPLLENVWDALTDKLDQNILNTDTYLSYIHENCTATGCDYFHFFSPEKSPHPTGTSKETGSPWQDFSLQGALFSKAAGDSLRTLLFDYLNADRFPILQPSLYHLLTPYSDITEPKNHTVESNFYKYHYENILSLAENITPSMEQNGPSSE